MGKIANTLSPRVTDMIRLDHTHVLATFHQFKSDSSATKKQALVNSACIALDIHAQLEEEIFYPVMRATPADNFQVEKSIPEHAQMRRLIDALRMMTPDDRHYDQTFLELMRDVMHHVADEETILLPDAERVLSAERLSELGAQMTRRRLQLLRPHGGELASNAFQLALRNKMVIAGALIAGSYVVKRAWSGRLATSDGSRARRRTGAQEASTER